MISILDLILPCLQRAQQAATSERAPGEIAGQSPTIKLQP